MKILSALTIMVTLALPAPSVGQSSTHIDYPLIGHITPRHASEIEASNWSVGAETMDRDYSIYKNWREYLGPLGVKKARIQAGWAKTEQKKGVYDWRWLDEIIVDMAQQGVEPWVNVSYGNPLYRDGGGTLLGARIPRTEEALEAWDRWVGAMVDRYKDYVDEWEIWNEPNGKNPATVYADLLIRSAQVIRSVQPEAKILGMALAGIGVEFADSVLAVAQARDQLGLIDEVVYHPYSSNPDASYDRIDALRVVVEGYSPNITIRQGENGAPSEWRFTKALRNYDWTELTQAKWALRRLLGDLGRDIPTSYFAIIDMKYPDEINRKGLLRIHEDRTVARPKLAYYAVQNLASVFDRTLDRIPQYRHSAQGQGDRSLTVFGYEQEGSGRQVVTLWFDDDTPSNSNEKVAVDFTTPNGRFDDPVFVDLREGTVFDIPDDRWSSSGTTYTFIDLPVYDSPVLIADASVILR